MKVRLVDTEKLMKDCEEKVKENKDILESLNHGKRELDKEIEKVLAERKELQAEIKEIEAEAYKGFLKKMKLKSIQDYESQRAT